MRRGAFTLIELLVVIAIIGLLMTVALPRIKGFGQSNSVTAATRQLLDDVALARATAIASRSEVYMVFLPAFGQWRDQNNNLIDLNKFTSTELTAINNLLGGQYTTYALYAERSVGDQPGKKNPRYLTPWKTLPNGVFIRTNKFDYTLASQFQANGVPPFLTTNIFRFPTATNGNSFAILTLPYIGFDYQGRLSSGQDEILPIARGSIFYPRTGGGLIASPYTADPAENPPNNSVTLSNHVRIDWLTGRAHVERQNLQ